MKSSLVYNNEEHCDALEGDLRRPRILAPVVDVAIIARCLHGDKTAGRFRGFAVAEVAEKRSLSRSGRDTGEGASGEREGVGQRVRGENIENDELMQEAKLLPHLLPAAAATAVEALSWIREPTPRIPPARTRTTPLPPLLSRSIAQNCSKHQFDDGVYTSVTYARRIVPLYLGAPFCPPTAGAGEGDEDPRGNAKEGRASRE